MIFNFLDIISIGIVAIVMFGSSFALFFPLALLFKNFTIAKKYVIPISLSIEIIFGYIFYSVGYIKFFPQVYASVVSVLNIVAIWRLQRLGMFRGYRSIQWKYWYIWIPIICVAVYTRFFDAVTNIAPGNIDTFNHTIFLNDLQNVNFLSNSYYAPGFHFLLFPLVRFLSMLDIYRFAGPCIGLITLLAIYLVFADQLKHTSSRFLLIIVALFPVFNQLTLQTISFFPSAVTFLFFVVFIHLLSQPSELTRKQGISISIILSVALAVTVPYFYIQYLLAVVVIALVATVFRKHFSNYRSYIYTHVGIVLIALMIGVAHVFVQTKAIQHTGGFPEIPILDNSQGNIVVQTNTPLPQAELEKHNTENDNLKNQSSDSNYLATIQKVVFNSVWQRIDANPFLHTNVVPMFITIGDIIRIKNIRSFNSILAVGSYVWIICACISAIYCAKKRLWQGYIIMMFSIVYGVIVQTGMFEMSFYRGRSGWYLMQLSILGAICIFDYLYKQRYRYYIVAIGCIMLIASVVFSPQFYRTYYPETFQVVKHISDEFPNEQITVIANSQELSLVSNHIRVATLMPWSLDTDFTTSQTFIILEKKFLNLDPVLSQRAYSSDTEFSDFNNRQNEARESWYDLMQSNRNHTSFGRYQLYWENDNIEVYRFVKP